jgi:hypothetical protein
MRILMHLYFFLNCHRGEIPPPEYFHSKKGLKAEFYRRDIERSRGAAKRDIGGGGGVTT